MQAFARLLDDLAYQPRRNGKLRLIADYFGQAPDPDRGYALAALTGRLDIAHAKPALIRALVEDRVDPVLFRLSYDYVGDLAETVALIWPARPGANRAPGLAELIDDLNATGKAQMPGRIAGLLDALDATGRWALIKLMTGAMRVGVSARLAKTGFAAFGDLDVDQVEEVWHGQKPPFDALFAWAERRGPQPRADTAGAFRPVMLAHPLDEADLARFDPADFAAEWKWDGIRVQVAAGPGRVCLWSRTGEDIGRSFPDLLERIDFAAVLDGELLVMRDGAAGPFGDLQRRLNRKTVSAPLLRDYPVGVRLYDVLFVGDEDLRALPFADRRRRLEDFVGQGRPGFDLSELVDFASWNELAEKRLAPAPVGIEGLMLKRLDSAYLAGRPKGPWFKWKRDPHLIDAVLLYAQRGHGKRSSYYSDYTFGVWRDDELVPVGKAYFGFTDEELAQVDKWVRQHTVNRFGPVREVTRELVLEVAFEGVQVSKRHKSGLAMRFPRISRIRWDKPAHEADRIETVAALAS
ncbi:MAG: cisplatin damage response ATP-dependent DNA ligase [Alphaproteobacteria bacterium]